MDSLTKHMLIHESSKKYRCLKCNFRSLTSDQALVHVRLKHLKEKVYSCTECPFQTSYAMGMKRHLLFHYGYTCSICKVPVGKLRKVKQHMLKIHNISDFKFPQNIALKDFNLKDYQIKNKKSDKEKAMKYIALVDKESNDFQNIEMLDVEQVKNSVLDMSDGISQTLKLTNCVNIFESRGTNETETSQLVYDAKGSKQNLQMQEIQLTKSEELDIATDIIYRDTLQSVNAQVLLKDSVKCPTSLNIFESNPTTVQHVTKSSEKVLNSLNIFEARSTQQNLDSCSLSEPKNSETQPAPQMLISSPLQNNSESLESVRELFKSQGSTQKGHNPMLSATSNDLGSNENSLIDDSLFDLMTDFPRPSNLNRCQSASTLMFTSFSPHLVDRPLTPDFFSDSPSAGSFFSNFTSKSLEADSIPIGRLTPLELSQEPRISIKTNNPSSPMLSTFLPSSGPLTPVKVPENLVQSSSCENLDYSVFGIRCPPQKSGKAISFSANSSAFTAVGDQYSRDLQIAVASITEDDNIDEQNNTFANEESPFPMNSLL